MSKKEVIQEESLFENLNMNPSREEGETYEDYKIRRKRNKHILKLYMKHGREVFKQAFPDGVTNDSLQMLMEKDNG
tara:strand:- start:662 stop:889 length:228 start_codon:yes stop_codon:yes gene_type:complete